MQSISSISELEALYGQPSDAAIRKVSSRLTPLYRR
ncbi:MAG: pyridoxamine 5'-phosphate oxidase family protein, partial [Rhodobacteraceae bacterium]|nr:pyridoxamine 5'-phosphate oxidase family protein [Paracoccaceae bacterium]